ncbi:MAG: MaoC/PaaZ C-terminal domain-containing protein, partial [Ilumatobacteraceae bacterium]
MVVPAGIVGVETPAGQAMVDARWTMAYAASIGDGNDRYFDTAVTPAVHPMFPVCFEWPVIVEAMETLSLEHGLTAPFGSMVHAGHVSRQHRPLRPPESLMTSCVIRAVRETRAGVLVVFGLETTDESGAPVVSTEESMMLRGETLDGGGPAIGEPLLEITTVGSEPERWEAIEVAVDRFAAHTYSECARIWNPIHTDSAHAAGHGLPGIILHGTATAARALTVVVDGPLDGDPTRVTGMSCRFTSMVLMPNTLTIRHCLTGETVSASVINSAGDEAISHMAISLG